MNLRDSLKIENGRLKVGNYFCSDLVKKFGSPLYIMDAKYMKDVASSYVETMNSYGDGAVAFASKSFCSVATSKLLAKQGMWFDAVSGGEVNVLDNAGVDLSCVILHGNAKTYVELEFAISKGVGLIAVISRFKSTSYYRNYTFNLVSSTMVLSSTSNITHR